MKTVLVCLALIVFGLYALAYYTSGVEKSITVQEKWIKGTSEGQKYLVSDTDNNVFKIADSWWQFQFDASDRWARVQAGKSYDITAYGWRIHFLSEYPNILRVTPKE